MNKPRVKKIIAPEIKESFLYKFGFPFLIIVLVGVIVYLGSVVGSYEAEKLAINALIHDSEPNGVFSIPTETLQKKWGTFASDDGDVSFRFPLNWRTTGVKNGGIIREGEGAIISLEASDAAQSGESMIAYRVAKISALQDLKYPIDAIEEATLSDKKALVLQYRDEHDNNTFYDVTFLAGRFFYSIVLAIKNDRSEKVQADIIDEFKKILSTFAIPETE